MKDRGFHLGENLPTLKRALLIAGFGGWGNALNVASGTIDYLVRRLEAEPIGKIDPDTFYRYDESRPVVRIEQGELKSLDFPGGSVYAARTAEPHRDLILLQANEPQLRWFQFAGEFFDVVERLGADTAISLGSMYDSVLHTDRLVSGIASTPALTEALRTGGISPVSYQGPSAIHSTLMAEGRKRGIGCISLWAHCPYYLQGATHFGVMAHLSEVLAKLGDFQLETDELEADWRKLHDHIQGLVDKNEELQQLISGLRKQKLRGMWSPAKPPADDEGKVINLLDFLDPK
jgi:proteasome assembly chaperone (PAC2) family protein